MLFPSALFARWKEQLLGRSKRPVDSQVHNFGLCEENEARVRALRRSLGTSTTGVIERELDFIRAWGLTPRRLSKLEHAIAREGATPQQYVTALLEGAARELPRVVPSEAAPTSSKTIRGNMFFRAATRAFVLRFAESRNLSFPRAVDELLTYARTYNLSRGAFATLDAAAQAKGGELRDLVLDIVSDHTILLGEPSMTAIG